MVRDGKLERVISGGRSYVTADSLNRLRRQVRTQDGTPTSANAELVASIERLVKALREERSHLLEALQEREAARVELAAVRAELGTLRATCQCGEVRRAA